MKCPECKEQMVREIRDHHYTECGLSYVELTGVPFDVCKSCGEEMINIRALDELHRIIAGVIITTPTRLIPEEIKFLRKHLGWGLDNFAQNMDVDESTARKWESGELSMGIIQETYLRVLAAAGQHKKEYLPEKLIAPTKPAGKRSLKARANSLLPAWLLDNTVTA